MRRRTFLPEVQALRAVAVLLVVLYHFWPLRLPGGFVGVDVFFVISGFLITSHLHREVEQRGRVSLTAFYARRARRLLPASLLVLFVTGIASFVFLPVTRWVATAGEILASTFYVQNWMLAARAVDYSASANAATQTESLMTSTARTNGRKAMEATTVATATSAAAGRIRRARRV